MLLLNGKGKVAGLPLLEIMLSLQMIIMMMMLPRMLSATLQTITDGVADCFHELMVEAQNQIMAADYYG
jgi:hypothetical protein